MFETSFDRVSSKYDQHFKPLPDEYVRLVQKTCGLTSSDRVIDLGCGTGRLTLPLARISKHVEGLDISARMLDVARKRDDRSLVRWHHAAASDFEFGESTYKLIISYESFHLFPEPQDLVRRSAVGLHRQGVLAVGWMHYEWESLLKEAIVYTFAAHGLSWGEWGYQSCRGFPLEVEKCPALTPVSEQSVTRSSTSTIEEVADLLTSIDKALSLPNARRQALREDLLIAFRKLTKGGLVAGDIAYCLAFARRV